MKYQYHDLSSGQFEELVINICFELLGSGVQGFAQGRDGGRDARFNGKAQEYPSRTDFWDGTIIVQAKHTSAINAKFSDPNFFGNNSSVVNEEIARIKKLLDSGSLDYYLLFSNRDLPAGKNEEILNHISNETGLEKRKIALIDTGQIERYLKLYPKVIDRVSINPFEMPLILDPSDLADLVIFFNDNKNVFDLSEASQLLQSREIKRTEFTDKNEINNLSEKYANIIEGDMATHFDVITQFLAHPANRTLRELYDGIVNEFNMGIAAHEFESFDRVLNYIYTHLTSRDIDLKSNKKLTRVFLHYMYYFCDIGEGEA